MKIINKIFIYIIPLIFLIALVGCNKTMQPINFNNLILPNTPNYALAAYKGYPYPADFTVRTYEKSQKELAEQLVQTLKKMPRTECIKEDNQNYEYTFIQKTMFFRFPDWIDIKVYAIDDHSSTFVMLSRSQYGHSDFGTNKKRIKYFLKLLKT